MSKKLSGTDKIARLIKSIEDLTRKVKSHGLAIRNPKKK